MSNLILTRVDTASHMQRLYLAGRLLVYLTIFIIHALSSVIDILLKFLMKNKNCEFIYVALSSSLAFPFIFTQH